MSCMKPYAELKYVDVTKLQTDDMCGSASIFCAMLSYVVLTRQHVVQWYD